MNKCHFCSKENSTESPLMDEGYFDDMYLCRDCWFSDEVKTWRSEMKKNHEGYRSYSQNITAGFELLCPSCDTKSFRYPKFIGHSPSWELCCDTCENVDVGFSPYEFEYDEWLEIYEQFQKGAFDIDGRWGELVKLSNKLDLPKKECSCGGNYSILAKPLCRNCKSVIYNSVFHVCGDAPV